MQRHKGTEAQRHRGAEVQSCKGTKAQRYKGTEVLRYRGAETQRHRGIYALQGKIRTGDRFQICPLEKQEVLSWKKWNLQSCFQVEQIH